jgi:hypothetical protein
MTGTAVAVDAGIALRQDAVKPPAVTGLRTRPCVAVHRLARAWPSWAAWPPRSTAASSPPLPACWPKRPAPPTRAPPGRLSANGHLPAGLGEELLP